MTTEKSSTLTIGKSHLRIFPSLVMDPILHRGFLVFLFGVFGIEHFGFIEEFMVKAQDFLVLAECRLVHRCHFSFRARCKYEDQKSDIIARALVKVQQPNQISMIVLKKREASLK